MIYTQTQQLNKGLNIITVDVSELSRKVLSNTNQQLGRDVPYKLILKGHNETEEFVIGRVVKS
jgi:hypothetical protein